MKLLLNLLPGLNGLRYNVIHSEEHRNEIYSLLETDDEIVKINSFGSVMELKKGMAEKIKKHPKVLCIEEDQEVKMAIFEDTTDYMDKMVINSHEYSHKINNNEYFRKFDNNEYSYKMDSKNHYNKMNSNNHYNKNDNNNNDTVEFRMQYNTPWGSL